MYIRLTKLRYRKIFFVTSFFRREVGENCALLGYSLYYIYSSQHNYIIKAQLNPLKPNDPYSGRTAPLTSKRCILYIYSTNTGTQYFKHGIYSSFFSLQNAVCFIILTYLVPGLFTFYIQNVLKLKKKIIPAPKG